MLNMRGKAHNVTLKRGRGENAIAAIGPWVKLIYSSDGPAFPELTQRNKIAEKIK